MYIGMTVRTVMSGLKPFVSYVEAKFAPFQL